MLAPPNHAAAQTGWTIDWVGMGCDDPLQRICASVELGGVGTDYWLRFMEVAGRGSIYAYSLAGVPAGELLDMAGPTRSDATFTPHIWEGNLVSGYGRVDPYYSSLAYFNTINPYAGEAGWLTPTTFYFRSLMEASSVDPRAIGITLGGVYHWRYELDGYNTFDDLPLTLASADAKSVSISYLAPEPATLVLLASGLALLLGARELPRRNRLS